MPFSKLNQFVVGILNYIKNGSAIGVAFAIALLINAIVISISMLSAPVQMSVDFYFSEIPMDFSASFADSPSGPFSIEYGFSGCFWMPLDGAREQRSIQPPTTSAMARVRCSIPDPLKHPNNPRTGASLAEKFDATPGWTREDMIVRVEQIPGGIGTLLWLVPFLAPTLWLLLRNLDHYGDFNRAAHAVAGRPWILLAAPVAALAISTMGYMVIPSGQAMNEHSPEFLASMTPPVWLLVFVLPLVEEAVFRQWLYVRIVDRLPVWVGAISSSWAFMLLHILNPTTESLAIYLPTMFVLGITFFWLRHRFQSFSLAVIAHMTNNGLFLGIAALSTG